MRAVQLGSRRTGKHKGTLAPKGPCRCRPRTAIHRGKRERGYGAHGCPLAPIRSTALRAASRWLAVRLTAGSRQHGLYTYTRTGRKTPERSPSQKPRAAVSKLQPETAAARYHNYTISRIIVYGRGALGSGVLGGFCPPWTAAPKRLSRSSVRHGTGTS